jgi:5-methylcytosine-specific restriction protein A
LRLANQPQSSTTVHLFEVFQKNQYAYAGRVALVGPGETEQQLDEDGNLRTVFVFPLKLRSVDQPPIPTVEQIEKIRRDRQRKLKTKSAAELRQLAAAGGKRNPGLRKVATVQYERDEHVVAYVKKEAYGICDLCRKLAPFTSADGPYLECHHVEHLADGGADAIDNAVALCPNCHRKMRPGSAA